MIKVKIYIMKLEYDNTFWLFIQQENYRTTEIKLNKNEYLRLKKDGIPDSEEILLKAKS